MSSAYVAPSIVLTDSPPYVPSGAQAKPSDDNVFISTYTYTEFTLTMNATGSPPVSIRPLLQPTEAPQAGDPFLDP
ncbi:hypothetical protein SEUCBS139899_003723 [Sporothrix eucalyptigena]|uniref:Uncharacterized protein n=1 Tax=Sporothrix eucalyptigena TaxID=1812306 RepID=A0ABP0BRK0_9PEZI